MHFQEKLLQLNKRGLVHAPDESDESFFLRCRNSPPIESYPRSTRALELYDIEPDWVWLLFENKGLRFWEGGCTWIERNHISLQLNKAFKYRKKYFGYARKEVIAHELVHVVRASFEEPVFEEILAYQTSTSAFRRYFGPILRTTKETTLFWGAFSFLVVAGLFSIFQSAAYMGMAFLLMGGSLRLFRSQQIFRKTRKKLSALVGKEKALPVMLRLTDREIIRFSKMSGEQIITYAGKMKKIQIRWQQITGAYFPET